MANPLDREDPHKSINVPRNHRRSPRDQGRGPRAVAKPAMVVGRRQAGDERKAVENSSWRGAIGRSSSFD